MYVVMFVRMYIMFVYVCKYYMLHKYLCVIRFIHHISLVLSHYRIANCRDDIETRR